MNNGKIKIGILICDRYRSCAGGKCFRALRNREGAFSRYEGQDVELVGNTTCGGCPGVDATGHAAEITHIIQNKSGCELLTDTGAIVGERPMWADRGERSILDNTKEVFPGVYAAGLCCNVVFGGPRMGPIFGGMLLSGEKVAELLDKQLAGSQKDP